MILSVGKAFAPILLRANSLGLKRQPDLPDE